MLCFKNVLPMLHLSRAIVPKSNCNRSHDCLTLPLPLVSCADPSFVCIRPSSEQSECAMEELMTNLILVGFNLTLDFKDTVTHHPQVAANYEAEKSSNITEVRSLPNPDLHTI